MSIDLLLKIFFNNTVLIGTFFVLCGILKVFIYFKLFGIFIFEFFDLKEVVTLFANNLLAYFAILIFTSSLFVFNSELTGIYKFLIPAAFTIFSIIYYFLRKNIFVYETILQNLMFWILFFVLKELLTKANSYIDNYELISIYVLAIFLMSLSIFSIINAFNEFYKVKYKKYYSKTELEFENSSFTSNDYKYYIGKTDKYIFIYDNAIKSCEVIPTSRLKKIIFRR